jgi:valyl-tRNA synthetase
VLETILRLNHPIMPFITEELWQKVAPLAGHEISSTGATIMNQPFPEADANQIDNAAEDELEWVKTFISGVRKIRSEMDIAPGRALPVLLQNASQRDRDIFISNQAFINSLAKLESTEWLDTDSTAPESATALVGEMQILIPLAGLIDKEAELARLDKEIAKLVVNLEKGQAKLQNSAFVDKAPAAVVEKERQRVDEMDRAKQQLEQQAEKIRAL